MRLAQFATVTASLILLAELMLVAGNFRTRRRAESLLASLRELKVDSSTFEDAQPILATYKANRIALSSNCASGKVAYGILVSNRIVDYLGTSYPLLLKVGVRPVSATAVLSFAGGRLCEFRYSTAALLSGNQFPSRNPSFPPPQLIELDAQTAVQRTAGKGNYDVRSFQTLLQGFRENGVHLGVRVIVTPDATPPEFQQALTFDLSCFTSLRGCRTLSELMPLIPQGKL